ncbi:hypothetical protein COCSADRAFT_169238 [Bipolaris sorokiniana ND90Pr]|uniref:Peptidase S53 domain-containing protein n=1 Tax=Cochliobolus sativus (strain ND90Pr / ATCC 201652) TaxID=665912 RepID=M2SGA9_COCSN|nr:uncharacterized protein COCSADRAFT_169238 [Bipolaris sorokiniana ND90Pr]EMD66283.1 hypothetical protein COCSADRAFT_169238 [Bipolaris sorokiniana ND90Pr]
MWLFVTGITFSCASLAQRGHVLHEERRTLPYGWQKGDRLEPDIIHPARIALAQNELERGEELLMAISDPDSPLYGQHWTQEEVRSFFIPSDESVMAVQQWLEESIPAADLAAHPITQSRNKGWIEFSATVQQLENLLGTEFYNYHHDSGRTVASTEAYYVPASVGEHVDFIWPGIILSHQMEDAGRNALQKRGAPVAHPIKQQGAPVVPLPLESKLESSTVACSNNHSALEPACIRDLYGVPQGPAPSNPNYTHAIYTSGNDKYKQEDLDIFWSAFAPEVPKGTVPKQILIDGAADTRSMNTSGGELFVDLALTVPLVAPNTITIISPDDPVAQADTALTGGANSMLEAFDGSYCTYSAYNVTGALPGWDAEYPNSAQGGYKGERQCGGVKPPSVLVSAWGATEDYYPISFQRRQCNEFMKLALQGTTVLIATGDYGVAGNGPQCWGSNNDRWTVVAPANCPYVEVPDGPTPRTGQRRISPQHLSGRGVPDLSAIGTLASNFMIDEGVVYQAGGTSVSVQYVGALITRINLERLAVGKPVVGFINPVLYKYADRIIRDITQGESNRGCNDTGYPPAVGWDAVTGLGVLKYKEALNLWLSI